VSVDPTYLETRSSPDNSQYFWAYRVVIENQGRETVQLLSRHWMMGAAYQSGLRFLRWYQASDSIHGDHPETKRLTCQSVL
jgi:hypothetical protein